MRNPFFHLLTNSGVPLLGQTNGIKNYTDSVIASGSWNPTTNEITLNSHGMASGDGPYRITTAGTIPAGITATVPGSVAKDYWIINIGTNTFKLANSYADAVAGTPVPVDFTTAGTGNHTLQRVAMKLFFKPAAGEYAVITSLRIILGDNSVFSAAAFGAAAALTNGCLMHVHKNGNPFVNTIDVTAGVPLKSNLDFALAGFTTRLIDWGSGNDYMEAARSNFPTPIYLNGDNNEWIDFHLRDNMTSLTNVLVEIEGYYADKSALGA